MRKIVAITLCVFLSGMTGIFVQGQENPWEELLKKEVEVVNPNYKPVLGAGVTFSDFRGDIRNANTYPAIGNTGYKVNVHMFLDPRQYIKSNLYFNQTPLTFNQRSSQNPSANLNFRSDLIFFGLTFQYDFKPFINENRVRPFVATGAEFLYFNTKGDLGTGSDVYYYWPDGTIRNKPFSSPDASVIQRDYLYETDLLKSNMNQGLKRYSRNALSIPVEAGIEFPVSYRIALRFSLIYHYLLTDYVDNIASKNTPIKGDGKNDHLLSTSMSIHFDLFSDPKTRIQNLLFAEVDFDYTMYNDEDEDMVFDGWDRCPGTPKGIPVDTSGCPFDKDGDGVPDYKDKEPSSPSNAIVDLNGIAITDDTLAYFFSFYEPVERSKVDYYLKLYSDYASQGRKKQKLPVPQKLKPADLNGDNIISYEEIMKVIDHFYDFESQFTYKDIKELILFFFSQ